MKKEIKIQKEMIVKEKSRIQEKTKEIRQTFSKAAVSGESGRLVFEHCKKLVSIWDGSANIELLSFEISSGEFDDEHQEFLQI